MDSPRPPSNSDLSMVIMMASGVVLRAILRIKPEERGAILAEMGALMNYARTQNVAGLAMLLEGIAHQLDGTLPETMLTTEPFLRLVPRPSEAEPDDEK